MKPNHHHLIVFWLVLLVMQSTRIPSCSIAHAEGGAVDPQGRAPSNAKAAPIPMDQIGAVAGKQYQGDGLAVTPTAAGARLHCVFQRLNGEATRGGLWLASTVTNQPSDRFRVQAAAVGRDSTGGRASPQALTSPGQEGNSGLARTLTLPGRGTVTVAGQTVRFTRAGLVEEYSVSMDGVRQDFVVPEKPAGEGQLKVQLAVTGARVEPAAYGAQLVLDASGRKLVYSRVHATDANGKELPARIEVASHSALRTPHSALGMAVVVNDAGAVYPVRIDPTFSDANWLALGSGMNGTVNALAMSGNTLYAGGSFTNAGGNAANYIAQWNGSSWSPLGSGMGGLYPCVYALAMSGGALYAGGQFTTAGGNAAKYIAQWNGSSWTPLGLGMNGVVRALAVSGGNLYASGEFTTAGGTTAIYVAQWNGSSWSPLGSGMNGYVYTLAILGNTLCAGSLGGVAQWNGSSWSWLPGMINYPVPGHPVPGSVHALAVSGDTLYAGGWFTTAGGNAANHIAQWNGSSWSALGSGLNGPVTVLVVSGGILYAGGWFTTAGGDAANYIAQWNGSSWSALGSGMNTNIYALAVSGAALYAGGDFTTAGTNAANYVAQALLVWSEFQSGPVLNTDGSMTLTFSTGTNCSSRLYAATNLAPPVLWQPMYTNVTGGLWQFTDTNASGNQAKFYRLSTP